MKPPFALFRVASLLVLISLSLANRAKAQEDNVETIEHQGALIRECSLPGETLKDDVVPRHANALQVSRKRWLVVYSTHGFRGVDDERSIVYQLRQDAPDGKLIREGFLAQGKSDWKPEGVPPAPEGINFYKQHGHMVCFGVPRGAMRDGKLLAHANVFTAKRRVLGRPLDVKRDYLEKTPPDSVLFKKTQGVEWVQFRLNDAEDDIEVLQPARLQRQKGYEKGEVITSAPIAWMNQSFCPPVPFNDAANEWVECNHFDGGRLAVLKYRFDPQSRLYEWVETGPLLRADKRSLSEASLLHVGKEWLVATRTSAGLVGWVRTPDPFKEWPALTLAKEPQAAAPLTAFTCPDGVVRLLTGDRAVSPQRYDRDPLYCWDVLPDKGFAATNRRTIFDSVEAKLPIRKAVRSKIDFCELFPHHGRTQLVVHGVSTRAFNHPFENTGIPPVNAEEKKVSGIYYAKITYRKEPPALWEFARD